MRVAVFFTFDYSFRTWKESGTLEREMRIFDELNKKYGYEFIFFSYGDSTDSELMNDSVHSVIPIYAKYFRFSSKILRFFHSFLLPFYLQKYLKKVDILYQNQLFGSWVPILVKVFFRNKLVIRTGYDMLDFAKNNKKKSYIIIFYKFLLKISINYSNLFYVSNKTDMDRYKVQYKSNFSKILLRQNWVERKYFNKFEDRFGNRILSVGRLESQKNYKYLISEFKNTKGKYIIDIVGHGSELESLQKLSDALNVEVNFINKLKFEDLNKLYSKYRYFISSSTFEGNPKTLLEALSNECAVFASNIDNHSEIINHNENGFLYNLKEGCLINLFNEKINNLDNIQLLSKEASISMYNRFSINNLIEKMNQDFINLR